jgi:translation initiation factor eIF-2B subunit alpha
MTIMTHGYSKAVISILLNATKKGKRFNVMVTGLFFSLIKLFKTEGRPYSFGYKTSNILSKAGIPVTLITDSAVAHLISKVDFVLSGAEGVVENGGIIHSIGSYQLAIGLIFLF